MDLNGHRGPDTGLHVGVYSVLGQSQPFPEFFEPPYSPLQWENDIWSLRLLSDI